MDKKDSRYFLNLPYPYNLIKTVCMDEDMEINEDHILGLQKVLETLIDREQDVLVLRFMDRKSFHQIGELWGLPTDRVRSIYEMTLRKIRKTPRFAMISFGYHGAEAEKERVNAAERTSDEEVFAETVEIIGKLELSSMSIQELDLPVRITNRLIEKEILTIKDLWIISQRHPKEYSRIHGLGETSREQINEKLRELGFIL